MTIKKTVTIIVDNCTLIVKMVDSCTIVIVLASPLPGILIIIPLARKIPNRKKFRLLPPGG